MSNLIPTSSYISEYIDSLTIPGVITRDFLAEVGVNALKEKQKQVEDENGMLSARLQKRIPTKLQFDDAAAILMSIFTFKNIRVSERSTDYLLGLYVTTGDQKGTYITNHKDLYRLMDPLVPYFRNKDMDDVLDKIERIVPTVTQSTDPYLFIVNNGIFNQKTKTLEPFSPDHIYLTKIPINYNPNATNPILIANDGYQWDVETWIQELSVDDDTATLIWQVIADTLQPHRSRGRSIWFYAQKGNNGKGTIGQLIKNLLGVGNYSSLAVTDFRHEFLKQTLVGIAANISDENDVDVYIDSIRDFKASITGDDININRKFEKPIRLQFRGTNIQMMNGLPKTRDKSDSFYRRLLIVPFLKSFTNNGERKYIKDVYIHKKEVLEYVLYKAINLEFDEFITPKPSQDLLEDYKELNNPVMQYWNELEESFQWDLLPTQFLYDLFVSWSKRNNPNGKPMSKRNFIDTLTDLLESNNSWETKLGQNDKIKTGTKMDADEPLITEYNLVKWMDPQAANSPPAQQRAFIRNATYRGVMRL